MTSEDAFIWRQIYSYQIVPLAIPKYTLAAINPQRAPSAQWKNILPGFSRGLIQRNLNIVGVLGIS